MTHIGRSCSIHRQRSGARPSSCEDVHVLHLRLIVPFHLTDVVVAGLSDEPGVAHIVRGGGSASQPTGDVIECDVVREAANGVVEWLQDHGVHHTGAIAVHAVEAMVSDSAEAAEAAAPGESGDALVWEELEGRVRSEATLTISFLVFMAVAAIIAGVGILIDSSILVIGAMVVGPDYGPLAALCVAMVRRRSKGAVQAGRTLVAGLAAAISAAFVATLLFRLVQFAPETYDIGDRELTAFISRPDGLAAVVAVLAGIVGMLSLTEGRSSALIGVVVSVTTIPAAGNIGVAAAYGAWSEVGGAALQLAINVTGVVIAGAITLWVQSRSTHRGSPDTRPGAAPRTDFL
jgi:uncharacterized hydrophobic protein (TIGR00271 family)